MRSWLIFLGLFAWIGAAGGLAWGTLTSSNYTALAAALPMGLAALGLAAAYRGRFSGSALEALRLASDLNLLIVGPVLLAWLLMGEREWAVAIICGGITLVTLLSDFWKLGRYKGLQREFPELQGPRRALAEQVLEGAGLECASMRVLAMPSLNAFVQGMRRCLIVVDRRVCDSFDDESFAALIAHEAGHVFRGGTLTHRLALPLALTGYVLARAVYVGHGLPALCAVAAGLLGSHAIIQSVELACDRFAARMQGAEAVGRMLERVHNDQPHSLLRLVSHPLVAPFLTHPPLEARLAALGLAGRQHLRKNQLMRGLGLIVFLGIPSSLALLAQQGFLDLPTWFEAACWSGLAVLLMAHIWIKHLIQKSLTSSLRAPRPWKRLAYLFAAGLLCVGGLVAVVQSSAPLSADPVRLAGIVAMTLGVFLVIGPWRRLGKAEAARMIAIGAALSEGKVDEALQLSSLAIAQRPNDPQLLAVHGAALLANAQLDEARKTLQALLAREPELQAARLNLAFAELADMQAEACLVQLDQLHITGPLSAEISYIRGLAQLELRRHEAAHGSFLHACELKPSHAPGWAGRALVELAENGMGSAVSESVQTAAGMEAQAPLVLLAQACVASWEADPDAVDHAMQQLEQSLKRRGGRVWLPLYRHLLEALSKPSR